MGVISMPKGENFGPRASGDFSVTLPGGSFCLAALGGDNIPVATPPPSTMPDNKQDYGGDNDYNGNDDNTIHRSAGN
jgi:hypothetical protein